VSHQAGGKLSDELRIEQLKKFSAKSNKTTR